MSQWVYNARRACGYSSGGGRGACFGTVVGAGPCGGESPAVAVEDAEVHVEVPGPGRVAARGGPDHLQELVAVNAPAHGLVVLRSVLAPPTPAI